MKKQALIPVLAACALMCSMANAVAERVNELEVKAAIFINLARFIDWPADSDAADADRFTVCIAGDDIMKPALFALSDKPIRGRALKIRSLKSPEQISGECRALYVSTGHDWHYDLAAIASQGVLTVGDDKHFLYQGGGILISRQGKKLGFSINRGALDDAGLRPSSRILALAAEIY